MSGTDRYDRPIQETVDVNIGELVYANRGNAPVRIIVSRKHVYVGCHKLTWAAWDLLKKTVDSQE
jgi:hypothetical protein